MLWSTTVMRQRKLTWQHTIFLILLCQRAVPLIHSVHQPGECRIVTAHNAVRYVPNSLGQGTKQQDKAFCCVLSAAVGPLPAA